VLNYRVAVLSPSVITQGVTSTQEPSIAVQVLRAQVQEVLRNISDLSQIPGSELVRTQDGQTMSEVKFRLEELIRYRVEPLATTIHESGIGDRQEAINFVSEQIAYDQRKLGAVDEYIASARDSLTIFSGYTGAPPDATPAALVNGTSPAVPARPLSTETVMPQISEGFIDRLFALTKTIADAEYRQKAIEDMRKAVNQRIPLQQDLSYHQHVLEQLRRPARGNGHTRESIDAEITRLYADTRKLVEAVNQLYNKASTNLSPSTHLYTLTSPSLSRTERTVSLMRLLMTGVIVFLTALVLSVAFALLHARIRHEEWEQSMMRAGAQS
jgi:hypothetical protein